MRLLPIILLLAFTACKQEKYSDDEENCELYADKTYDVEHAAFYADTGSYKLQVTQLESECPTRTFVTDDLMMAQTEGKPTLTFSQDEETPVLNIPADYKINYISEETAQPVAEAQVNAPAAGTAVAGAQQPTTVINNGGGGDSFWMPFVAGALLSSSMGSRSYYYPPPYQHGVSSFSGYGSTGRTRDEAVRSYSSKYQKEPAAKRTLLAKPKRKFSQRTKPTRNNSSTLSGKKSSGSSSKPSYKPSKPSSPSRSFSRPSRSSGRRR